MNAELEELTGALQRDPKNSRLLQRLGAYYMDNGYYKQARDEFHLSSLFSPHAISEIMLDHESAISKNPKDIQARLSLISFCAANNDIDAAVLELEELLEIDPKNLQAYNVLGRILIQLEKIDEAMALLEKAYKLGIKDLTISEMLASVYLEKQRFSEAIRFYEELPKDKKNLRTLAELYLRVEDHDRSAEKYFSMYEADPEVASEVLIKLEELLLLNISSVEIREFLFEIYARTLHPDLAVKNLNEIIKIAPQKIDTVIIRLRSLLKTYPLNPEATLALSEMLSQKGNYSEAIEEYSKLVKSKPDLIGLAIKGALAIIQKYPDQFLARQFLIETHMNSGKIKDALNEIKFLLKIYPESADWVISKCKDASKKNSELKECLGLAYLAKNDYTLAGIEAENLLTYNRQNIAALLLISETLLRQKLCRKAVETLHKALEISPYDPEIHKKYREAKLKELELEALEIKKRIASDEWKVSLHLDFAKNCVARNDKEEAVRALQIVLKDTQKASQAYSILGGFYRNDGLYEQSLDAYRKALNTLQSENQEQYKKLKFGMSLTYEAQGNVRYAVKMLEEIEQVDIDHPGLRDKIKFLRNTNIASLQNKSLAVVLKNEGSKDLLGLWGRESKKTALKSSLSVSFGQNYNNSGIEFFLKGMHEASEEEFTLASQLDPHYIAGVNNLAVAGLLNKKLSEALSGFKRAFEIEPGFAIVLSNLGLALFLNGFLIDAESKLMRAVEIDPELSCAKINLADTYYSLGKMREAISLYQQVPQTDVLFDLVQQRLQYKLP